MKEVPNWPTYFMNIAHAVAARSKDPATQVGCVIIDENKHIVGTGYNGMPPGCKETAELWERPTKYEYVIHAEANAIVHATKSLKGCTLYTTLYPCKECAKLIVSAGITSVIYDDGRSFNDISALILEGMSGVTVVKWPMSSASPN